MHTHAYRKREGGRTRENAYDARTRAHGHAHTQTHTHTHIHTRTHIHTHKHTHTHAQPLRQKNGFRTRAAFTPAQAVHVAELRSDVASRPWRRLTREYGIPVLESNARSSRPPTSNAIVISSSLYLISRKTKKRGQKNSEKKDEKDRKKRKQASKIQTSDTVEEVET